MPDFAGHYRVVPIGCGAGAVCPAFIDGRNGRVVFPPTLRVVSAMSFDVVLPLGDGFEQLNYRQDSRLLVTIGAVNENEDQRGVSYYDWREGRPRLIAFVPTSSFCAGKGWKA